MYTVGSLFSGIGGIDLAFSWAGFDVRWQIEIEPFCQAVLRKHATQYWPNARIHEDVAKVTAAELSAVDVMAGGFPCQDVSMAGKRQGIKENTRSGLWFQFARLIGELRPRVVLLENVPGLLTKDGVRVIADLTRLGYDAEWGIVPASAVGAPHRRDRWFCVAYSNSQRQYEQSAVTDSAYNSQWHIQASQPTRRTIIHEIIASSQDVVGYAERTRPQRIAKRQIQSSAFFAEGCSDVVNAASAGLQRGEWSESALPSTTRSDRSNERKLQTQPIMGRAVDGLRNRVDGYKWPSRPGETQQDWESPRTTSEKAPHRQDRIKALGNAVVPQVVYPIAVAIREYLDIR